VSRSSVSGHFIEGTKGPVFVLCRMPVAASGGCILVAPPFAEEMNKCRRMVTEVALRLAERGVATLVPDLYGTGDSGGDFSDGDWATWQADIAAVVQWGASRGVPVNGMLAIRLGCALAAAAAVSGGISAVGRTALWQPVFDGARFLSQFLRLRIAANLMSDQTETLAGLRGRLRSGEALEVAGYRLSGRLAIDLEACSMPDRLPDAFGEVAWLEVVREPGATLAPPSLKLLDAALVQGGHVNAQSYAGEPFWSSTEIVVNRQIVSDTVAYLLGEKRG
jgi:exosortase A-associated hydrolase 2